MSEEIKRFKSKRLTAEQLKQLRKENPETLYPLVGYHYELYNLIEAHTKMGLKISVKEICESMPEYYHLNADLMRSQLVHYASSASPAAAPILEPTMVRPHEAQRILRLNPDYPTTVTIYDISGKRLQTLIADGVERLSLQAESVAGCYQIVVQNGELRTVLRYIVGH